MSAPPDAATAAPWPRLQHRGEHTAGPGQDVPRNGGWSARPSFRDTTVPAFQGRGIGSAFLQDMLQRADADGLPAYHEATSPRNRALYERHGYVNQGELVLPDGGPTLWRMWRDPR
jgi:GNAT superfamily N-acetyltransferase